MYNNIVLAKQRDSFSNIGKKAYGCWAPGLDVLIRSWTLISTPLLLILIRLKLIRARLCTLKADPRAKSIVSFNVSLWRFNCSEGPQFSRILKTTSTSLVELYLRVAGLKLNTPLKNRESIELFEMSFEMIREIADLMVFNVPYAALSENLFDRHISTDFSSPMKGFKFWEMQNCHQYFNAVLYCLAVLEVIELFMIVIVLSSSPFSWKACRIQSRTPGKDSSTGDVLFSCKERAINLLKDRR